MQMKTRNMLATFYKLQLVKVVLILFIVGLFTGCINEYITDTTTFKGQTLGQFIESRPEDFSEFSKLLDTTGVKGSLKTYVKYTCFLPNNTAMTNFYASKGRKSLADFPLDSLKKMVYDHLISGAVFSTSDFKEGRLSQPSMSDRFISITYADFQNGSNIIKVNKTSPIVEANDSVHNGIVHVVGQVLSPTELNIVEAIGQKGKFKLFYEALVATGLYTKLLLVKDDSYTPAFFAAALATIGKINEYYPTLPQTRKYGYTALIESDSTYNANGISTLTDLKKKAAEIYGADSYEITDSRNCLNRFIAYHLVNKQISFDNLIKKYDTGHMNKLYDMYEYIEPMCSNTLIEVKIERGLTNPYNLINKINGTGKCIKIIDTDYDNDATNGVFHEIDNILAYTNEFAGELSGKRLRLEGATFFPELTNNNLRGFIDPTVPNKRNFIPRGYCDRLKCSENTRFCYLTDNRYEDFQGDEIWMRGMYDFSITTPVIPAGTYEIRMGYQPTGSRGAAQLYWDSIPCGIPLDLRLLASNPKVGYEMPGTNTADLSGFENDKMMRNRGYMKGPDSYFSYAKDWYKATNARYSVYSLRRVLTRVEFKTAKNHTFTVKAIREGEFMLDYLEFVPVEMLENEDTH
jgi:uncharacterized surface protein with fasciclin (FAS1) repeats